MFSAEYDAGHGDIMYAGHTVQGLSRHKLCEYSHVVREMFEATHEVVISDDLVHDRRDLVDFVRVDLLRSPSGVMKAANALNATSEWYNALYAGAPMSGLDEVGWELLHYVLLAKEAGMAIADSLFKAAWKAASCVKGWAAAKHTLEVMETANKKGYYLPPYMSLPDEKGMLVIELARSAVADGEMAEASYAIQKCDSNTVYFMARAVLSVECDRERMECALRAFVKYRKCSNGGPEEWSQRFLRWHRNVEWYSEFWAGACATAVDLRVVMCVIVDQFVNVCKHDTLANLVHLLCGETRRTDADKGIARLLAQLPSVGDGQMCDAVQALRVPVKHPSDFAGQVSNVTLDDMMPLLEWAETHKAFATARHIVEMALQNDNIKVMDRAVAVWRCR